MPAIDNIRCSSCGLKFPSGWGGYTYVTDSVGHRILCAHPGEARQIKEVTGLEWGEAWRTGRIGKISYCMCFSCTAQFELDLDRDTKRCPKCGSLDVKSANGAITCTCPQCKTRVFQVEPTGMFS